jgi:hypothetical protein
MRHSREIAIIAALRFGEQVAQRPQPPRPASWSAANVGEFHASIESIDFETIFGDFGGLLNSRIAQFKNRIDENALHG